LVVSSTLLHVVFFVQLFIPLLYAITLLEM